ncbi:hypothetical protein ZOSMA_26G00530 [Zostera marina]|uniref:Uncharacterized protein n=1 Tax=Zostera marina TaxID=29655 RepID=A0A0K9PEB8_ZOSMR|nr:hypothetical protein ZOSMA_26G00530 [Zostera marina]
MPRHPTLKPIETFNAMYGKNHYIIRFQDAGVVEAEFARIGYRNSLQTLLTIPHPIPPILSEENPFGNEFTTEEQILPAWFTQEDLDYYTTKFTKSGFTGPLNYYRCLDKNWELMAPWHREVRSTFLSNSSLVMKISSTLCWAIKSSYTMVTSRKMFPCFKMLLSWKELVTFYNKKSLKRSLITSTNSSKISKITFPSIHI